MQDREKEIYKVTIVGTIVNAVLIVLKFFAGIYGKSAALVADAVHSLSDFITDVIVLVFVKISSKPEDNDHEYGHGKYETFATMIIGIILCGAGVLLGVNGLSLIIDIYKGEVVPEPTYWALAIAFISIVAKEILFRYTVKAGKELNSSAVMANAWHHRSDAISSVGTLFGIGGAMLLGGKFRVLDPLAAVLVSLFIIKSGIDILKPSVNELLETALPEHDQKKILSTVMSVPGVVSIDNLRTRRIGNNIAIELHAQMDGNIKLSEAHTIATEVENKLRKTFGSGTHVNIHMEPKNCDCHPHNN